VNLRRILLLGALALGLVASGSMEPRVGVGVPEAVAKGKATAAKKATGKTAAKKTTAKKGAAKKSAAKKPAAKGRGGKKTAKVKLCSDVKVGSGKKARTKKKCNFVKEFQGHGVRTAGLPTEELARPSGALWLRSDNLREEVRVQIYKEDGSHDEEALAKLDEIFRCKRSQEVRAMDPRLYDQLARISDHFGGKQIIVVSGFRFKDESNSSRHYHASAMDIRIAGESVRSMYAFAESLDRGEMGIGIYPHSGFIHVDYRAPGERSYRWTDYSGPGSSARAKAKRGKAPGRTARAKRPTS
jgi:uncharacterized protein YcbK (DUF882 family)